METEEFIMVIYIFPENNGGAAKPVHSQQFSQDYLFSGWIRLMPLPQSWTHATYPMSPLSSNPNLPHVLPGFALGASLAHYSTTVSGLDLKHSNVSHADIPSSYCCLLLVALNAPGSVQTFTNTKRAAGIEKKEEKMQQRAEAEVEHAVN